MLPKKITSNKPRAIVASCITLVIGILFCCSSAFGKGLDWLLGGSLCFAGIMYIVSSIIERRSLLTPSGIVGAAACAFGIMFICERLSYVLTDFVPYLVIAFGLVVFAEAFFAKFARFHGIVIFIIALVIGAISLAFGICILLFSQLRQIAPIVFGCILIIASLYTLISILIAKKDAKE